MRGLVKIMLVYVAVSVVMPLHAQFSLSGEEIKGAYTIYQEEKRAARTQQSLKSIVNPDNWQSSVAYKGYAFAASPFTQRVSSTRIYHSYAGGNVLTELDGKGQLVNAQLPSNYTAQKLNLMASVAGLQDGEGFPDPNPNPNPDPNPTPISDIPWGVVLVLLGLYVMYKRR
ncbi:MAG: hypothetical protein IAA73_11345 [Bacteroidetes bacterium]|uniref:Uncharacterized protein n=1 Tax=Candidatus Gallipaludibacter merdavium TaxID=2840839 RepID=A0A9D9N563_9BACT|nr:hypothetical protein [Candidatus Gallipaludibacter merdavium]